MKKIIVAGAGHGGLSAAALLASAGFDVTVFEAGSKEELGHDWHDSVRLNMFDNVGIPYPDKSLFLPSIRMRYTNPKKNICLQSSAPTNKGFAFVDRKGFLSYLISYAESKGVKLHFNAKVLSAVCDGSGVIGLRVEENGKAENIYADMVIDAAGIKSPVRQTLPEKFGIPGSIHPKRVFTAYRAYYNNTNKSHTEPTYTVFFCNCGRCGMDWMITEDNFMDVLIGKFGGELTKAEIDDALKEFKLLYPSMGDALLRGGSIEKIPVGFPLSMMVCNGYAAVGDSASMTEPLSGSGICMSMEAGKVLADTIKTCDGKYTVENLWQYQYKFYKNVAQNNYQSSLIKDFLSSLTADDIDWLIEKKILTAKEIAGEKSIKYGVGDYLLKGVNVARKPQLLVKIAGLGLRITKIGAVKHLLPEKYSRDGVEKWRRAYENLSRITR